MKPSLSTSPAASFSRAFQVTVLEPARSSSYQPLRIGPTESARGGMLTVAAAIKSAGVVLSQLIVRTTPSTGNRTTSRPVQGRHGCGPNWLLGACRSLWIGRTGISIGTPPAAMIPSLTFSPILYGERTRIQVATGLCNRDDRLNRLQFLTCKPVVHIPL